MLLWWLQVVLPLMAGTALLAWCSVDLLLNVHRQVPGLSLRSMWMGILAKHNHIDENKLKSRLAEVVLDEKSSSSLDKKKLEDAINERIFGQEDIVRDVVAQIYNASFREDRRRPVCRFMIAGPSGTAKSLFGEVLADARFGKGRHVLFDMSTAFSTSTSTSVFGSPMGHVGSGRPAPPIAHLISHPASVVIVDEFEKTAVENQNRFLRALEQGVLTDVSSGQVVDLTQAILVFTTNAMADQCARIGADQGLTIKEISDECKRILKTEFPAPILSRLDRVYAFQPLKEYAKCELVYAKIIDLLREYRIDLVAIDQEVLVDWIKSYRHEDFDGRRVAVDVEDKLSGRLNELKQQGVQQIKIHLKKAAGASKLAIDKA
ncbi:hypothetical protein MPAR162_15295 [Methylorubrum populi]|uniref:ATPase AAA-type core domain-containing protein n=2 Tax=Methylobacteriaceae TaxID=119045 RepID=A0ABU7T5Z3_9HYPH